MAVSRAALFVGDCFTGIARIPRHLLAGGLSWRISIYSLAEAAAGKAHWRSSARPAAGRGRSRGLEESACATSTPPDETIGDGREAGLDTALHHGRCQREGRSLISAGHDPAHRIFSPHGVILMAAASNLLDRRHRPLMRGTHFKESRPAAAWITASMPGR